MKLLLHICCAPCLVYPLKKLSEESIEVWGFFYNPNIHPFQEYKKRLKAVKEYTEFIGLQMIYRDEYNLSRFLQNVVFREEKRCLYCYHSRLEAAAQVARRGNFDYFSSTLLYSTRQDHLMIKEIGEGEAKKYGVAFYYQDFREGWKKGIAVSKELEIYRQQYCGCIYSEEERFLPKVERKWERS